MNRSVAHKLESKKESEKRKREEVEKEEEEGSDFDSNTSSEDEEEEEEHEEEKETVKEAKKAKKSTAVAAKKDDDNDSQVKKPRVQKEPYLEKNIAKILTFVSDCVKNTVDDDEDIVFDSIDDLSKKENHSRLVLCKALCSRVSNVIDPLIKKYEKDLSDQDKEVFKQTRNTFVTICNRNKDTEMIQRQLKKV